MDYADVLQCGIEELIRWIGAPAYLAKHSFSCRVFEQLLEHCQPEQLHEMVSVALANVGVLCTHSFGNYVLQQFSEYTPPALIRNANISLDFH